MFYQIMHKQFDYMNVVDLFMKESFYNICIFMENIKI